MRKTTKASFDIDDRTYRKVNLAAASGGLSSAEFIRGCIAAGLQTVAMSDPILGTAYRMLDEREAESARELAQA